MIHEIVGMKVEIEMLKTAFGNALKIGPVEEIDAEKGYRLKLGDGPDGPFLSPWLPHPESGKSSVPLKKGDVVGVMSAAGDMRKGAVFRAGYSGPRPSPNDDMEANVFDDAGVRVTIADGLLKIEGNVEIAGNVDFKDGYVKSNGVPIDDTHKHEDVTPGAALTGVPAG
ncbi:baseplate assembly protein [Oricola indica]|jgi:phage baseplate assembly protein gpV|uniref:baseplate assembly protein n=1 Tax=Oricola indica TaxID=2872591 RepID=UPI001CBEEC27|nr:baseplate assembly protein [Oricola indica]